MIAPLRLMLRGMVEVAPGGSNVVKDWPKAFEQRPSNRLNRAKRRASQPLRRVNARNFAKASRSVSMCLTSLDASASVVQAFDGEGASPPRERMLLLNAKITISAVPGIDNETLVPTDGTLVPAERRLAAAPPVLSVALKASTRSARSISVTSVLKPWRCRGHTERVRMVAAHGRAKLSTWRARRRARALGRAPEAWSTADAAASAAGTSPPCRNSP